MFLSVVIPTYNEQDRIIAALDNIVHYLDSLDMEYEIIISDDGSTDSTLDLVENYNGKLINVLRLAHKGKGSAVRNGILAAKGDYILFSDADLSCPINEMPKLLSHLQNGIDLAFGSRDTDDSRVLVHQPILRELMGKTFNVFVRATLGLEFKDTQCGFKMFKRAAAINIFKAQALDGFSFDVEAIYLAKKYNYRIKEVGVSWINSPQSKVNITSDPVRMLRDLFLIKKIHAKEKA
jgi:dolichyl-phosphate beta-glucosyltransferase